MEIHGIPIGPGHPCFIIAEVGINHNGDIQRAFELMQAAKFAGANAVKFQKRTLDVTVPLKKRSEIRYGTPWGDISYWDYKHHLEFELEEYLAIQAEAERLGICWFASPWDPGSVDFLMQKTLSPCAMKIASASVVDLILVDVIARTGLPVIMSTGMSDIGMIDAAFETLMATVDRSKVALLQCTATYPSSPEEQDLRVMQTLRERYRVPIGFSNHSPGLTHSQSAVALGADIVEAHITLDRAGWGSDQAASIEPHGFRQLVGRIRSTEAALGDGIKKIHPSEAEKMGDLRKQ